MGRFRGRKEKGERYDLKKIPQKAEEMTQQVGALQEVLSSSQNQHVGSLLSVTPVLQDPTSSSGHQYTYDVQTDMEVKHPYTKK